MKFRSLILSIFLLFLLPSVYAAQLLEHVESESGTLLPGYTGTTSSPFTGVVTYANGDGVDHATTKFNLAPGRFRMDVRGASSSNSTASIGIFIDGKKIGSASFSGTAPSIQTLDFSIPETVLNQKIRFILETDNGSNDTLLDWYELHYVGEIPPPPPAPTLPLAGSFYTGDYRNIFAEAGYSQAEITAKLNAAYNQLFHSTSKARDTGEAIFLQTPGDATMAYIWDTGNDDVRSEGLSYGMMAAVQMNRQEDFNKIWKWANTYALNTSGDMKGYFAWQTTTSGQIRDKNPAPDGEEYMVTALFFASHRWGDGTGIFNYSQQANKLLDDMFNNGQTRYNNQGQMENFSLFDHNVKQVVFSPATPSDRNWTDPSYHLPAFYELWARWADNNNDFWAELAVSSRAFFKTTVHPVTGLSPDYAYFDGRPHGEFQNWKNTFQYDAWRTISNSAMDYAWFKKDEWAVTYSKRLQSFLTSEGVDSYASLYNLDGARYQNNTDHSPGLVAMNAIASLASDSAETWAFVQSFWNTPVPTGRYRYYDGTLYMFGMLAASGNYRIYCPDNGCINASSSSSSSQSTSSSSSNSSSISSSSSSVVSSSSSSSLASSSSVTSSSQASSSSSANSSIASVIRVQAENFFGQSGIQTETTSDVGGGSNIGYINNGDYATYSVNVPVSGSYRIQFRVASNTSGGTINIVRGSTNLGSVAVARTNGWQTWTNVSTNVSLNAGTQTLRLNFPGGSGYLYNINWFELTRNTSSSSSSSSSSVVSSVSSSSSSAVSSSSSSSSAVANGLTCTHVVVDQWSQGFTAAVRITNNTSSPISGWSATWGYSDGSVKTNTWNANVSGNNPYTATPLSWLNTVNPGQTIEIGVQGTKGVSGGSAPTAVVTCN